MPKGNPIYPEIIRQYWREKKRQYRERKKKEKEKSVEDLLREAFTTVEGEPKQ
jgi:hypothetical protein